MGLDGTRWERHHGSDRHQVARRRGRLSCQSTRADQVFVRRNAIGLRRTSAVHESAEEEIVHPRAKRRIANGAAAVDKRLKEEHEAKTEFTRHLTELRDAVLDHAGREETD